MRVAPSIKGYEIPDCLDSSTAVARFMEALGICGCGNPEESVGTSAWALQFCEFQNELPDFGRKRLRDVLEGGHGDFVLYALDRAGFLEHGGSIFGSWRTPSGNAMLTDLKAELPYLNEVPWP